MPSDGEVQGRLVGCGDRLAGPREEIALGRFGFAMPADQRRKGPKRVRDGCEFAILLDQTISARICSVMALACSLRSPKASRKRWRGEDASSRSSRRSSPTITYRDQTDLVHHAYLTSGQGGQTLPRRQELLPNSIPPIGAPTKRVGSIRTGDGSNRTHQPNALVAASLMRRSELGCWRRHLPGSSRPSALPLSR